MNTFDVVVIFLLSNVVQNAIIGNDTSLIGGIIGAVTLVAVNTCVNRLIAVNATAARIFDGRATTVISDGHIVDRALRRLGMRRSELDTAVHLQDADNITEVETGSLEPGGQLVLTLKRGEQGATKSDVAELPDRSARSRTCSACRGDGKVCLAARPSAVERLGLRGIRQAAVRGILCRVTVTMPPRWQVRPLWWAGVR